MVEGIITAWPDEDCLQEYELVDTARGSVEFHTVTTPTSGSIVAAAVFKMESSNFVKRKCPRWLFVLVWQYKIYGLRLFDAKGHFKSLGVVWKLCAAKPALLAIKIN